MMEMKIVPVVAFVLVSVVLMTDAMPPPRAQHWWSNTHVDVQPADNDRTSDHTAHRPQGHDGIHGHGHEYNMEAMSAPMSAQEEHDIADASHHFAGDIYGHMRMIKNDDENIFISPFSLQAALSMAMLGAEGRTREEIIEGLHFHNFNPYRIHAGMSDILEHLDSQDGYTMSVANGAFISSEYLELSNAYVEHLQEFYSAELTSVNFADTENAKITLNNWVANATDDMIPEMFESVDEDLVLVLINALYFKGDWATEFDNELTGTQQFHLNVDETMDVEMMFINGHFNYYYDASIDTDVVELPYKGNVSMYLAVPRQVDGIRAMEDTISHHVVHNWHDNFWETEVDVYLPKFQLEDETDLNEALMMLGMHDMFSNDANFSGISDEMAIMISEVIQKAVLKVNEEGSEAAAATDVGFVLYSSRSTPEVKADRPFVLYIIDNALDLVLFMGRVQKPQPLDDN